MPCPMPLWTLPALRAPPDLETGSAAGHGKARRASTSFLPFAAVLAFRGSGSGSGVRIGRCRSGMVSDDREMSGKNSLTLVGKPA